MSIHRRNRRWPRKSGRTGAAVVEFAIVLPLIALILIGSIDVGQAIYVSQVVNEASREAARQSARYSTVNAASVESSVKDFIKKNSIGMSNADVSVSFTDSGGTPVANGDLSTLATGSTVNVSVVLNYGSVRWIPGLPVLNGKQIGTQTIMRRE